MHIPGEAEFTGRGVSYCGTCDGFFTRDKDIHIIGGGDTALEEALFLTRFARSVTVIHRRDALRAGAILEKRARSHPKIHFLWNTIVDEIRGEEKVSALQIHDVKTGEARKIPTGAVFIFIGHSPNVSLLGGQITLDDLGYVKIDAKMETNIPGVFAAGEIADPHYRQVITSAGMGAAPISATHYLKTWNACKPLWVHLPRCQSRKIRVYRLHNRLLRRLDWLSGLICRATATDH